MAQLNNEACSANTNQTATTLNKFILSILLPLCYLFEILNSSIITIIDKSIIEIPSTNVVILIGYIWVAEISWNKGMGIFINGIKIKENKLKYIKLIQVFCGLLFKKQINGMT